MLLYKFFNTLREMPDNAKHVNLSVLCMFILSYTIAGAMVISKFEYEAEMSYRDELRTTKMDFLRNFPCITGR